jgi:conjugative relaxase-like TrwC/TraI family protein
MLRITQQDSAEGAKRYYTSADYYSEGQEIIGSWGGRGARMLGLEGVVDKQSFDRLCDNLDPRDGNQLTMRTRSDRTVGYDFTFSVPKSVSLLYGMTDDRQIMDAFRGAVDETMKDIETEMQTRVRKGGRDENRLTGNMAYAEFIHTTSRPVDGVPDPQLHAHCFVFNSTWDAQERRWKAGQFRDLKRDAPYFQAAFRVRLAGKLQDLGFGVTRKRDDFEITGVPHSAVRKFSRRTEHIEKVAQEKGITDPKRKAELGQETREKKSKELSWDELRKEWDSRLTDQERQALAAAYRRQVPYARPVQGQAAAVDHALAHSYVREQVIPERKLLTEALKRGLGSVTVEEVKRELARRPLIRGEEAGQAVATTWEWKKADDRVVGLARGGRGRYRPLGNPDRPCQRDWLNQGQKAAVRHVLGSRDFVTLVRGPAGSGKTTLEEEIGDGLKEAGVPVVAVAQSTAAVDVLREEAHFGKADTLAGFLVDKRMQEKVRWGVVLVDEASLLGTRDMLALFDVAQELRARVVLVGDTRQNRAVSAGEPLRLIETRAGLPRAEVTEIVRQTHGDYRKAAQALSDGRTADGFAELGRLGWIKELPDSERYQAIAKAYLAATAERNRKGEPKTALVVTVTWAEAGRSTQAIREALRAAGKLGKEREFDVWLPAHLTDAQKKDATNIDPGDLLKFHTPAPGCQSGTRRIVAEGQQVPVEYAERFEVYRPGKLTLAVGDRLRVTAGGVTKDGKHKLRNGTLFTVKGFTKQGDPIVDHNWVIAKDWGHWSLGYAVPSESSQGKTVSKVIVSISGDAFGAANERRFYVPATRGKEQCLVFTDDKERLLKAVQRPDQPMSALELYEARQRTVPLRQRLHKHFAYLRRLASFERTHEQRPQDRQRTQSVDKERSYGR